VSPREPSVSVIVPAYNREALIGETLRSALAQDLPCEIAVVDDGSTDGTRDAVRALGGSLRLLEGENRGPAAARNRGIAATAGRYVAFLDSDDLWLPGKLSLQIDHLERNPSCAAVCSDANLLRGDRLLPWTFYARYGRGIEAPGSIRSRLWCANPIVTSTVVVRREALEAAGGFDESLRMSEDWDLWIRLAARGDIVPLRVPLATYRIHPENTQMRDGHERLLAWKLRVVDKHLPAGEPTGRRASVYALFHREHGVMALRAGDRGAARGHFRTSAAMRLTPAAVLLLALSSCPAWSIRLARRALAAARGLRSPASRAARA
jgi:glycosyltransferase involved in cell wall biosynthesis